ncbi:MAG: 2-C-methyl-D-erythritol 2,4-cyclodiphosphate synthase [Candidatus Omnitrophica bacterium]|nr:2-C-methyl-D-erythritol 2,4-cyclodiphosphate synthase [Candidatus Omnitrophota bacterium]
MRIGIGYDIHPLIEGRKLFLGGVEIPYNKGLLGHSDADALLHALCDAMLGAAGLGDIGKFFPDSEAEFHNISSIKLLERVNEMLADKGLRVSNVDSVVIADEPRLEPFKDRMQALIAGALKIEKGDACVKATSQEGLGLIGRGEAIAAYAVVLLEEKKGEKK